MGSGASASSRRAARARERVRGIHHVGITVSDLDRSLGFYRDLLGMRVVGLSMEAVGSIVGVPGASARIADLDAGGGQLLELIDYGSGAADGSLRPPDAVGSCHVSIEVDDLSAALTRLASAGYEPMGEVTTLDLGGVWEGCTIAYLQDPDGMVIELLEQRVGAGAGDPDPDG
jgi:catechol 2,3-dioxygenase-like lactoylglutathione lyase family enzyme